MEVLKRMREHIAAQTTFLVDFQRHFGVRGADHDFPAGGGDDEVVVAIAVLMPPCHTTLATAMIASCPEG